MRGGRRNQVVVRKPPESGCHQRPDAQKVKEPREDDDDEGDEVKKRKPNAISDGRYDHEQRYDNEERRVVARPLPFRLCSTRGVAFV